MIKTEKMMIGELIIDWDINPREKSETMIEDYSFIMQGYKEKHQTFDESWRQSVEITQDLLVVTGSHSLMAAKRIYGDQHEITVKIHPVEGLKNAKYLSAMSNVHGKPYKAGERKKCVYTILSQTQNLKRDATEKGKKPFLSVRDLASITGVSKGYVWELRAYYRAENNLPNEKGEILTTDELEKKKADQKTKSAEVLPTVKPKIDVDISKLSPEQLEEISEEELKELLGNMKSAVDDADDSNDVDEKPATPESQTESTDESTAEPTDEPTETTTKTTAEPSDSDIKNSNLLKPAHDESADSIHHEEEDTYYSDTDDIKGLEEFLKNQKKDLESEQSESKDTFTGETMGDTDVVSPSDKEKRDKMLSERRSAMAPIKELMNDAVEKVDKIELEIALSNYKDEVEFVRDDDGSWDDDVDHEFNGRDIIGSILLSLIDIIQNESKVYGNIIE